MENPLGTVRRHNSFGEANTSFGRSTNMVFQGPSSRHLTSNDSPMGITAHTAKKPPTPIEALGCNDSPLPLAALPSVLERKPVPTSNVSSAKENAFRSGTRDELEVNCSRPWPGRDTQIYGFAGTLDRIVALLQQKQVAGVVKTQDDGDKSVIGLCSDSAITRRSTGNGQQDCFPRLDLIAVVKLSSQFVHVGFRARMDTGCDLNLIVERHARRLVDMSRLPPSDLKEGMVTLTGAKARILGKIKLVFFVLGLEKCYKDNFYVIANEGFPEPFDCILGEKFLKAERFLEAREELWRARQNAVMPANGMITCS